MVRRLVVLLFILFIVETAHSEVLVMKDYWILSSGHQSVFLNSLSGTLTRTVAADNSKYGEIFRIDHTEDGSVDSYYRAYDASGNLYYYGKKRSNGTFFEYTPSFQLLPSSIEVGTTYRISASREEYESNNRHRGTGTDDFRITVTGPETVTVPAGTFTAYKIQMVDSWRDEWSYESDTTTLTYWVVKDFGIIKIEDPDQIYELSSSTELTQQLVTEIYVATFGRAPDNSGLNYWTNAVNSGSSTIEQVAQSFFDQPETKTKFPNGLSNSEFITTIYYNTLNRAPDAAGLAYWVNALDTGTMRRDQAIMAIINGAKSATGSAEDAAMLGKKTDIGVYFANSEIGKLTANGNFMDRASNIINFATSDDFDIEKADEYIAEVMSYDSICGAYVASGVWKEFDCYNLAAIGKATNDDPFTPSWRLIGGYWQWGRKGPSPAQLTIYLLNTVQNVGGNNPVEGFSEISFTVGGTYVYVDITSVADNSWLDYTTAYAEIVVAINAQLAADGFDTVTASLAPLDYGFFSISVAGFTIGDSAGGYYPILITNTGPEELTGAYIGLSSLEYDTDLNNMFNETPSQRYGTNTAHFAHGPTGPGSGDANDGVISSWGTDYAPDGAWSDSYKTVNDPCPAGYRVPTLRQWEGVLGNNTQNIVGTWDYGATNYTIGSFFGDNLMLPAAGYRYNESGSLFSRGIGGYYWSSTEHHWVSEFADGLGFKDDYTNTLASSRSDGRSVRCVAE